ncbi:MAG: twin-arginine translocase TatA/TatE family subunit [Ktedonobacterales bacterium]
MGMHWEYLLPLVVLALLIFGPKRLPEMGSSIGKTIKEFQRSMKEVNEPEKPTPPVALTQAETPVTPKVAAPIEPVQIAPASVTPSEAVAE